MAVFALGEDAPELGPEAWVAGSAQVIGRVRLGEAASVWFGAVLRGDNEPITVGARSNIQDGAVVHTDEGIPTHIGAGVSVGHMAMLHGCTVGDGSLIGMHATILNRAVIGKNCLIGAKTLIPEGKVIPDRSLVVGTPGRVIRELTEEEIARIAEGAAHYVEHAVHYRKSLRKVSE